MKKILFICSLIMLSCAGFSQSYKGKVTIKTTAQCDMCKETIEQGIGALEGVKECKLDLASNKLKVKFDESVIQAEDIREKLTLLGYQADKIPADGEAYEALPRCCQLGGGH